VPSEVYLRTRDALASLVSERAATRVLDAALRHGSVNAESLDEAAVRKLLLGPVQRELEGILPRAGLGRTLRRLARQVADGGPRTSHPSPVAAPSPRPSEAPAELHPVKRSSVYLPDVPIPDDAAVPRGRGAREGSAPERHGAEQQGAERLGAEHHGAERHAMERNVSERRNGSMGDVAAEAAPGVAAVAAGGARNARHGAAAPEAASRSVRARSGRSATTAAEPTVVPKALPPEALDRLTVRFAEIEGVTQVIGLRDRNDPPQVRGEGLDPEALAPLARSAIRLLGRHGPLRSLVLEHRGGLLFIFPLGRDAVAVLAGTDVNMGAVFAARAALEEAQ